MKNPYSGVYMIGLAKQILKKEWDTLRLYFDNCGDIGEFKFEDLMNSSSVRGEEEVLVGKTVSMYESFPRRGYASPEAFSVVTILASSAAEKLGLSKNIAYYFGLGFGFVRTGFISYSELERKQLLFHKLFFPLGGFANNYLEFEPSLVKPKIKALFERFKCWDENPKSFEMDYLLYTNADETWKEWDKLSE
ncbi:MAG: hypothetical protein WBD99_12300 [Thermodesulfobacteriota bacterium]